MKVNLLDKPPLLPFLEGDDRFSLQVRHVLSSDRAAILDALRSTQPLSELQYRVEQLVEGWEGVLDENGAPIPFEREINGRKEKQLGKLLGRLTPEQQYEVTLGLLQFIGIDDDDIRRVLDYLKIMKVEVSDAALRPTGSSGKPGQTPA